MKRACWIALALALMVTAPLLAGDIQVLCEPGLRVYLDGEFAGISTAKDDGLFLANIAKGQHRLWIEKDGFLSQNFVVDVLDAPIEVKVAEFKPVPTAAPEAQPGKAEKKEVTELIGNLVITSAPQNCVVEVDGKSHTKDVPELSLGGIAAGDHAISFSKQGYAPISGVVNIQAGAEVTVRGNLKEGRVEVVHKGKGSLRVFSTPTQCTLHFMGQLIEKTNRILNRSFVPAGEHPLEASWAGRKLTTTILIKDRQRTIVTISFGRKDQPFVVSYEPE